MYPAYRLPSAVSNIMKQNQCLGVTTCIWNILVLVHWNLDLICCYLAVFFTQILAILSFACTHCRHLSTTCFSSVFLNCLFLVASFKKPKDDILRVLIRYESLAPLAHLDSQLFVPVKEDTYFWPLRLNSGFMLPRKKSLCF